MLEHIQNHDFGTFGPQRPQRPQGPQGATGPKGHGGDKIKCRRNEGLGEKNDIVWQCTEKCVIYKRE